MSIETFNFDGIICVGRHDLDLVVYTVKLMLEIGITEEQIYEVSLLKEDFQPGSDAVSKILDLIPNRVKDKKAVVHDILINHPKFMFNRSFIEFISSMRYECDS